MTPRRYDEMLDSCPETTIVFGGSAMIQFENHLALEGVQHALFFMGGAGSADRSGAWRAVLNAASSANVDISRHMDIPPEPDVECVEAMVEAIEKAKPEAVVALGGGSVLDAAKAAYLSWQSGLHVAELFGQGKASAKFPGRKFKTVICMPTTAGTGSEATPYANIVDRKLDVKMLIVEKAIIPELAFVDPSFTLSMGEKLTMTTALDALAHAVEGFLNVKAKDAHPDSQAWAVEAIELIVKNLPVALKRPDDYAARESLAAAATLGGMVIRQRPTSLPHLCSFSFFDKVPHGVVVAALLPHFWRFYLKEEAVRERTMLLKGIFPGPAQDAPEAVVDAAEAFIRSCGAPKSLGELPGCDDALIAKIAAAAKKNPSKLESAPRPLGVDDAETLIAEVLRKAFAR